MTFFIITLLRYHYWLSVGSSVHFLNASACVLFTQDLTRKNTELESKLNTLVDELDRTRTSQTTDKTEMVRVHDIISRNVSELMNAQSQLAKLLNS